MSCLGGRHYIELIKDKFLGDLFMKDKLDLRKIDMV